MSPLDDVRRALAAISSDDLQRLFAVTQHASDVVPGLLAWLEHATDWEWSRREGRSFPLQPPSAAVDDTEADGALLALGALANAFRHEPTDEISDFFTAALASLHSDMKPSGPLH